MLETRFSSIEPKSPNSPLGSPGCHDNVYSLPEDDAVFAEDKQLDPPTINNNLGHVAPPPPTPGTAPSASGHAPSQRKPRLRHLACILVAIIISIGLVASVALILVFVNKDSTSPRSLPISASPRTVQELSYHGRLNLSSPWQGTEAELRAALSTDLQNMLQSSPWYPPLITASFVNISTDQQMVKFRLSFEKVELEDIVAASRGNFTLGQSQGQAEVEGHGMPVSEALQSELRSQVLTRPNDFQLPVEAPSIYVQSGDNIPIPETSKQQATTTTTTTSEGATSTQENSSSPITTTTELTTTSEQTATTAQETTTTTEETTTTTEETTTTAQETTTTEETTTTAEETTTTEEETTTTAEQTTTTTTEETTTPEETTITTTEETTTPEEPTTTTTEETTTTTTEETTTPEETTTTTMEETTTAEETTTTTTEETTTPVETTTTTEETTTTAEQTTTTAKETTTAEETTTTTTEETTITTTQTTTDVISATFQCVQFNVPVCNSFGFTETLLPNARWNCSDVDCLTDHFNREASYSIGRKCNDGMYFYCAFIFLGCSYDENNELTSEPILPCENACTDMNYACYDYDDPAIDCDKFGLPVSTDDNGVKCVRGDPCVSNEIHPMCSEIGFTATNQLHTWWSVNMTERRIQFEQFGLLAILQGCSQLGRFLYCGVYYPNCYNDMPCPSVCEQFKQECKTQPIFPLDCRNLDGHQYCLKPEDYTQVTATKTTTTTTTTSTTTTPITTTSTTTRQPTCEPIISALCETFGFTEALFPNTYGDMTWQDANKTYYRFAEAAVSSGCHEDIAFYICSVLFPPCDGAKPCRTTCEDPAPISLSGHVNHACGNRLFQQQCFVASDPDSNSCLKPPEKPVCGSDEFSCVNTNKCIPKNKTCDQVNDCHDWSDERDCDCHDVLQVYCEMGLCIPSFQRCDGKQNCPDESDEKDCTNCSMGAFECDEGHCIPPEWLCDNDRDCPNNEDEEHCDACSYDEFLCKSDLTCIPFEKRCDGTPDCDDSTDEIKCVFAGATENWLLVNIDDNFYPFVCSDGFTEEHGIAACIKSGFPSLHTLSRREVKSQSVYFQLDPNGSNTTTLGPGNILSAKENRRCPNDELIAIKCDPKDCGVDKYEQANLIVNGEDAYPGRWPWTVSMQYVGVHKCGGGVIHPYFILTAAHCSRDIYDQSLVRIVAGTEDLSKVAVSVPVNAIPQSVQVREIRRFIQYPGYVQFAGKDIALIELKRPLRYTQHVRPLCLPEPGDVFTRRSLCRLAGWGHTSGTKGFPQDMLQEAKMSLVDTANCNSSLMWDGAMAENERCAGYMSSIVAACTGDSGSSLVCIDNHDTTKAVGVVSYVRRNCSVPKYPMVYTDVVPYTDWIENTTKCIFTCANGICLFDKNMLCDSNDDCGDRSDEIQQCEISTNCTFDEKFMCGYKSGMEQLADAGLYINRFPLFDHTIGRWPGKFQSGKIIGSDLYPPRTDLSADHCIRFHYHGRGLNKLGFSVQEHELSRKRWQMRWDSQYDSPFPFDSVGTDVWLMGLFDLGPGHYDILFRAHDKAVWSIDDVYVLEGSCADFECFEGEFMCNTLGHKNCLPIEVRCNVAVDCDNAEDEKNCTDPSYICDFSNGNLCSIQQHTDDFMRGEWALVNNTDTPNQMTDHTTGLPDGTMLKLDTTKMLSLDKVKASMCVYLRDTEHCLRLFYFSSSPYSFEITLDVPNQTKATLVSFTDRQTQSWSMTQASLPAVTSNTVATLTLTVTGGAAGTFHTNEVIMLDDITITHGECAEFSCPSDMLKCDTEAYCVPRSKVCDKYPDCNNGSDEKNCICLAGIEHKCPSGPCILTNKTCNNIPDCPDNSDEGAMCDSKRLVTCDFEDPFQCGYTVAPNDSAFYHWSRVQGRTVDPGPEQDHTFISDQTQMGFYFLANSQKAGGSTSLTSPPFGSTGTGLVFFYHARHFLWDLYKDVGRLTLSVKDLIRGNETLLWEKAADDNDSWREQCVDLPAGQLSLTFVAYRGNIISANLGLDDVELLNTSCETFNTSDGLANNRQPLALTADDESGNETSPEASCGTDEYTCRDGMCINKDQVCDGIGDCLDGYDELSCD